MICTDKTGTLTQDEMTVRYLWLPERGLEVTGVGYEPEGRILDASRPWTTGTVNGDLPTGFHWPPGFGWGS